MTVHFAPESGERRERRHPWRALLRALRPVDRRFFDYFDAHAALAVDALAALVSLLKDVADPEGRVRDIEALEKRADGVMDEVRNALSRAWFVPFSRPAVHDLSNRIDDVLDLAEDVAQSLHFYHVTHVTPEAVRLAELAVDGAQRLQKALAQLRSMASPRAILSLCAEVDQIEAQADHLMRAAMSKLFREEPDAHQLVKLKAVYELLESLTDRLKDASNEVESIVLRHG